MSKTGGFPPFPVLVVDDEPRALQGIDIALRTAGISNTILCQDGRKVEQILSDQGVTVILLDLVMPHMSGQELLPAILGKFPEMPIIVVSGMDELDVAVECMRLGAFDYILKPIGRERLLTSVTRAIELTELRRENMMLTEHILSGQLKHPEAFEDFDSVNRSMRALFGYAESIAGSPEPVLITGETGVGKEIMARSIHSLAGSGAEFVAVNVAGLDENTFSDTLFGHVKGAFTGAIKPRHGAVETASGGTLFLDEIGDLGMTMQTKLLRLLQEREYIPLGSDDVRRTNARVIVATNKELHELRDSSGFRTDLYYRLYHHHIHIPPVRERRDDLPLLVNRFAENTAKLLGRKKPVISKALLTLLEKYNFPGNVRELKAMVTEAMSQHRSGTLATDVFQEWIRKGSEGGPGKTSQAPVPSGAAISFGLSLPSLKEIQTLVVEEALKRTQGNQALAAELLGVTRQALNRRLLKKEKK